MAVCTLAEIIRLGKMSLYFLIKLYCKIDGVFGVNIRAKYSMGSEFVKVNPDFIV